MLSTGSGLAHQTARVFALTIGDLEVAPTVPAHNFGAIVRSNNKPLSFQEPYSSFHVLLVFDFVARFTLLSPPVARVALRRLPEHADIPAVPENSHAAQVLHSHSHSISIFY